MFSQSDFADGIISGLIKYNPDTPTQFQPGLVLNDHKNGRKALEFLVGNITTCRSFIIAVAFVTRSGVACLHQSLKDFGDRGGEGKILVSTYLNFSDPNAINTLSRFSGLEVSFVNEPNFHGKTYLFEHENYAQIMIGSSNITQNALGKNTEINLSVSVQRESSLYLETKNQLNYWSGKSEAVSKDNLDAYAKLWKEAREKISKSPASSDPEELIGELTQDNGKLSMSNVLTPNQMQKPALKKLHEVRADGNTKSLIISATGTGKTVLAAFDVKQLGVKRLLFVVHRLNIAKKAMNEFKRVFGTSKSMGIYSAGESLNKDAEFIFCTVQTINSEKHLQKFLPGDFDYIIIDETHRAGAMTYKRVLDYFHPKFMLGMTATPERTDGFDIFSLFNHSIAYEIRLQKAMEADLLAPFHYFGVTDVTVEGEPLTETSDFNKLVSDDRVDHILEKIKEYGCDSSNPRGLIFCSRIEEARQLSQSFNARGLRSLSITGSDPEEFRETAIRRIESDSDDKLDYLFTVDVFNEGVDIPRVNLVVMLRPTTSAIIFIQQLGRGLRKAEGKDYLTVIDFIGNYQNNYLIPIALFGDASYNKDRLRKLLSAGSSLIPGASSISFEKIARERIFASIDSANLNTKKALLEDFELLKFRLGRTPLMLDFIEQNSRDPFQYVDSSGSLLSFTVQTDSKLFVEQKHLDFLTYLSKHVCDGVRLEENIILKSLISHHSVYLEDIANEVTTFGKFRTSQNTIESAIHNLNLHFVTERSKNQNLRVSEVTGFSVVSYDENREKISVGDTLASCINNPLIKKYLKDLIEASVVRFMSNFDISNYVGGFKRGTKYTRKDIFRILEWDKLPNAQNVGGYILSRDRKKCPIFVTYHKEDTISETTKYEDRFINPRHVVYMSKNRRTLSSPDVRAMLDHEKNGTRMPFFVKKNDDEGLDFYYLGELTAIPNKFVDTSMPGDNGGSVSVVKMEFLLDREVEFRLYKYLTDT